jgi:hypothetical protein
MRRILHWTVFLTVQLVLLELISLVGLAALERRHLRYEPIDERNVTLGHRKELERLLAGPLGYLRADPDLGWTIRENGAAPPLYRANAQGIRADREYADRVPDGLVRIATFGDSFTHASQVGNADTWEERLMERLPAVEVLNFGVGGFALDQAYLRYLRDGSRFQPGVVLIGFMSENIRRSVNVFRPFYNTASSPFSKPRFTLGRDGGLDLLDNPLRTDGDYRELLDHPERVLPRLGEHDYYFRERYRTGRLDRLAMVRLGKMIAWWARTNEPLGTDFYDPRSEAFQVTSALFDRFHAEVESRGSTAVILVFPDQFDVASQWKGRPPAYRSLLDHFEVRRYRFLDLQSAFAEEDEPDSLNQLFRKMHYSPLGNRLVAERVAAYLTQEGLVDRQYE